MTAAGMTPIAPMITFPWGLNDWAVGDERTRASFRMDANYREVPAEAGPAGKVEVGDFDQLMSVLSALDDHHLGILGFERATLAEDVADMIEARQGLAIERVERRGLFHRLADQLPAH